ncbi:MAG: peptide chain release factor N(5)-glutamine methyltransferase [Bacillota bacterium]|nr:peptide chain release factor N(5)-glutamine methyltransferase [Bacillota bacterium]
MVIKEAVELAREKLKNNLYTDPIKESRFILSYLLDKPWTFVLLNPDYDLGQDLSEKFEEILCKRQAGLPLDYIIKQANFYGRDFYVDPRALIPRWDTENLVEKVLEIARGINQPKILELGVGSGAISISLALELEDGKVSGLDISAKALEVARINLESYQQAQVDFFQSDLFEKVKGKYDIIVSNPPYIKRSDMETLQAEVKLEPSLALDGGQDGLDFYRRIIKEGWSYLEDGGFLVFEIGAGQDEDVSKIFSQYGYKNIGYKKDLQGFIRVIWAVKEEVNV